MTLSELRTYIRLLYDQDDQTLPNYALNTMIQSVEGRMNKALTMHPQMIRLQAWTCPAGENRIPVPERMMRMFSLEYAADNRRLEQYPYNRRREASLRNDTFVVSGDTIHVYPVPSEPTEYQMLMSLYLLSLTDDTSNSNWISDYHADLYVSGVAHETALFLRDNASAAIHGPQFVASLADLAARGQNETMSRNLRVRMY